MKKLTRGIIGIALSGALLAIAVQAEGDRPGYVDFGKLIPSANGEFVEVNISGSLIGIAARLAAKEQPEAAELLRGLQSIRVNVVGLDDTNRGPTEERIQSMRSELETKGWERIVTVKDKDSDVGVYIKIRGQESVEGVVVTVTDGRKQAVLVNVEGNIKPEKLAELGETLNIKPLKKAAEALQKK